MTSHEHDETHAGRGGGRPGELDRIGGTSRLAWLNGDLLPISEARVPITDRGLTHGYGCFETIRATNGEPLAVSRHLQRLRAGLHALDLVIGWTDDELIEAMAVVGAGLGSEARIRLTVTGGDQLGSPSQSGDHPNVFVTASPTQSGALTGSCVQVPWRRNEHSPLAGVKATSYTENVLALSDATHQGFDEAVLGNTRGELCEGTTSNIFVVLEDQLLTPPLSSGCLPGVTRALVLEVSDASERALPLEALDRASEVFLTSSPRQVQGQHLVGERTFDAPGPVTTRAQAALTDLFNRTSDP